MLTEKKLTDADLKTTPLKSAISDLIVKLLMFRLCEFESFLIKLDQNVRTHDQKLLDLVKTRTERDF